MTEKAPIRVLRELTPKEKESFGVLRLWLENNRSMHLDINNQRLRAFFQDVPIEDIRVVEDCEEGGY